MTTRKRSAGDDLAALTGGQAGAKAAGLAHADRLPALTDPRHGEQLAMDPAVVAGPPEPEAAPLPVIPAGYVDLSPGGRRAATDMAERAPSAEYVQANVYLPRALLAELDAYAARYYFRGRRGLIVDLITDMLRADPASGLQ